MIIVVQISLHVKECLLGGEGRSIRNIFDHPHLAVWFYFQDFIQECKQIRLKTQVSSIKLQQKMTAVVNEIKLTRR